MKHEKTRKQILVVIMAVLLFVQPFTVYALTSGEAKQYWFDAKTVRRETQQTYRETQIEWASDKTEENNQKVVAAGKESLQAALDEAEAWLIWRSAEVTENPEIPDELKEKIQQDVEINIGKIDELREEVESIENRVQLALVFLKMIGKYFELVSDVARNTGFVWVHIATTYADIIEDYENQIRNTAETLDNNQDILEKLDEAKAELIEARLNIEEAESEYIQVVMPGTPLLKFSKGNQHLRIAKNHMISAQKSLREAYQLMVGSNN